MKKILFVTFNDVNNNTYGGGQCSNRNLKILQSLADVSTVKIRKINSLYSILSIFQNNFPPLLKRDIDNILKLVIENNIDIVFLDSTLLGNVAKRLKDKCRVISFSHNVEFDYVDVRIKKGLKHFLYKMVAFNNERRCLKYSNIRIMLSKRDSNRNEILYKTKADSLMPITFYNSVKSEQLQKKKENAKFIGLFVGAFGVANYKGIKWFVENVKVSDEVIIKIVGKGFEKVKDVLEGKHVDIVGEVDNLEQYYIEADFVIIPLLTGGGMKVKTAEALMYGKTIFATQEAFSGYELDYEKAGALCNNATQFEDAIEKFIKEKRNSYNAYARNIFEEKYDNHVAEEILRKILVEK